MKQFFHKYPYWIICILLIVTVGLYQAFVATDRYVSEANVVLESPKIQNVSFNISSFLSGGGGNDLLLLRDHMMSVDMLKKLDSKLDLRSHYSNSAIDLFSRFRDVDAPMEYFHKYYLEHIEIVQDQYDQVLRIKAQAFNEETAYKLVSLLLHYGEKHMNKMGQRLAEEQVSFIEKQVDNLGIRLSESRDAVLEYQDTQGLISPSSIVESLSAVVAELQRNIANLEAKKNTLKAYQSSKSPEIIKLNSQIEALNIQVKSEQSRMATKTGDSLNRISEKYETLQLQANFSLDLYSNALSALENTRAESVRKLKQLSVLQTPTYPEYPVEPRRLYNTAAISIALILLTIIIHLLSLIINDHRD